MKYILAIAIFSVLGLSSCMTIMGKKTLFLGELPSDTRVYSKGKQLKIKALTITKSKSGPQMANMQKYILFKYPGVKLKMKKHTMITLTSGSKSVDVEIKTKAPIGFLIFTGIITLGISPLVDLCTNSIWVPREKLIDVPAYLNGKEPRSRKELQKIMYPHYFKVWDPPEVPEY